jgi:Tol biopolymer transport system component
MNTIHTACRVLFFTLFCSLVAHTQDEGKLHVENEKHLANIRQLTFGGENAEAYFSFDQRKLIYQSTRDSFSCDQIFTMDLLGGSQKLVSTGKGRTTCSYYLPGDSLIIFSSTHLAGPECPPKPDYSRGYIWPIFATYDIFLGKADGTILRRLTTSGGYDAEATVSPVGDRIVFTSDRDGDLEIYTMNLDGSDVRRLTHEEGYDGGAFFSPDGASIVFRGFHTLDSVRKASDLKLLKEGFVRPTTMEIYTMKADGSEKRELTDFGAASFAPYYHPDGTRIMFSSNMKDPRGRNFDLFLINTDGTGLEQVTFNESFDGFPMFTKDGTKLVFASNRNASTPGETNIFIADWRP